MKSDTREERVCSFRRSYQLDKSSSLPPQTICLSSSKTKQFLIEIISSDLLQEFSVEKFARKLVIVSNDEYPREVQNGEVTTRYDLRSMYDEADYKIPQQIAQYKKVISV